MSPIGVEPTRAVRWHSVGGIAIAIAVVVIGICLDLAHWNALCTPAQCHWTTRSGAIVIVCGTYLAFRAAAVLVTFTEGILRTNPGPSFQYGILSFVLIAGGTLLWAFGDLPFM